MGRARTPAGAHPFGRWLRGELDARGWTAADLADRLGLMPGTVQLWVRGRSAPPVSRAALVADALGVDAATVRRALRPSDPEGSAP